MSDKPTAVISRHNVATGSTRTYVTGYVGSICLTLCAYLLVSHQASHNNALLIGAVVALAFVQFLLQLIFVLHLGSETKPRWKLGVFLFMIGIVIILVGGSLWIMNNLDSRLMPSPQAMNKYMNAQDGL
jgi:cytochrome o ubiquinol oxidase operon protein cyoD